MGKYEEWYDYEDYDEEYENKKNKYELIFSEEGEERSLDCEDFEDTLATMIHLEIANRVIVMDRRNGKNVTAEFEKYLKEHNFIFYDEAIKELPELVCQILPKFEKSVYFQYEEKNFLKIFNLNRILTSNNGIILWKFGYLKIGFADKLSNGKEEFVLFIDRTQQDSPVYMIEDYKIDSDLKKEEILSDMKVFFPKLSEFQKNLVLIPSKDEYNSMLEASEPPKTQEEEETQEEESQEEEINDWDRGEKLDYSIETIDYKGSSFELLKFKYHEKEFVYSTESLGIKIAESGDIGSDLEKSIIEFLEDDEFESLKNKIAEVPYWNKLMEYCEEHYIRNDTVFYGNNYSDFKHNGVRFDRLKLTYDHMWFGYMLTKPGYSEEELKQIANDNRCHEVLDEERFYKMKDFMSEAYRHTEEFKKFCKENNIPCVIEEHEAEREFDIENYID